MKRFYYLLLPLFLISCGSTNKLRKPYDKALNNTALREPYSLLFNEYYYHYKNVMKYSDEICIDSARINFVRVIVKNRPVK